MLNARPTVASRSFAYARALHKYAHGTRPNISALPPREQPTLINEDGTKTLRLRQHGNRHLPLPPLMDPIALEAKNRHKQTKASPPEEADMSEFQKELAANPYAQALATTMRECNITKARLPSHFLLPFSTALETTARTTVKTPDTKTRDSSPTIQPSLITTPPNLTPEDKHIIRSKSYLLNRADFVTHLLTRSRWRMLVSFRMQQAYARAAGVNMHNIVVAKVWKAWDEEMRESILEGLRARVVEEVDGNVVPFSDLEGKEVGCILVFRPDVRFGSAGEDVPLYRLPDLLAPEQLETLAASAGEGHLAVLCQPSTVRLRLALDKLNSYLGLRTQPVPVRWVESDAVLEDDSSVFEEQDDDVGNEDDLDDDDDEEKEA